MFRALVATTLALSLLASPCPALAAPPHGHALPDGALQAVRERQVDILNLLTDLRIDLDKREVSGSVTITLTPLQDDLSGVSLDAAKMDITSVSLLQDGQSGHLKHNWKDSQLHIELPGKFHPGEQLTVQILYKTRPASGLYFF
ncbi:MAG: hypothetical protein MUP90_15590, partial [Gammaproteobacteria bacterium]|nr:hypothetical protein [Gammaproteobacteria bacterium]